MSAQDEGEAQWAEAVGDGEVDPLAPTSAELTANAIEAAALLMRKMVEEFLYRDYIDRVYVLVEYLETGTPVIAGRLLTSDLMFYEHKEAINSTDDVAAENRVCSIIEALKGVWDD